MLVVCLSLGAPGTIVAFTHDLALILPDPFSDLRLFFMMVIFM